MFKPAVTAVAAVLACVALSASARATTLVTDVNSCTRYPHGTTQSQIGIVFPLAYKSVTPGMRVYYMLNHYTSSGWQYTGRWQSLTAYADPYAAAGVRWQWQDGYSLVGNIVFFTLARNSGYYYVSTQVVLNGVASQVGTISPYYNFVDLGEGGWTSSCLS